MSSDKLPGAVGLKWRLELQEGVWISRGSPLPPPPQHFLIAKSLVAPMHLVRCAPPVGHRPAQELAQRQKDKQKEKEKEKRRRAKQRKKEERTKAEEAERQLKVRSLPPTFPSSPCVSCGARRSPVPGPE